MSLHGAACSEIWPIRPSIGRRLILFPLLKSLLVLFRALFLFGAVAIGAIVIVIGAVVMVCRQANNPIHFAFQGRFNRFRLAFSAGDAAHVRRVKIKLPGNAAVKTPEKGCEVERRRAKAAFDFCHH